MLKKYWIREHEDKTHVSHAMVFELEEGGEDELSLFTPTRTETYKDIKVKPELAEEQRGEVMKVLEEFPYAFAAVPGLTNLGKHSTNLTTVKRFMVNLIRCCMQCRESWRKNSMTC